jgi:hypothetical protein
MYWAAIDATRKNAEQDKEMIDKNKGSGAKGQGKGRSMRTVKYNDWVNSGG